jgi:hypothetical protein
MKRLNGQRHQEEKEGHRKGQSPERLGVEKDQDKPCNKRRHGDHMVL